MKNITSDFVHVPVDSFLATWPTLVGANESYSPSILIFFWRLKFWYKFTWWFWKFLNEFGTISLSIYFYANGCSEYHRTQNFSLIYPTKEIFLILPRRFPFGKTIFEFRTAESKNKWNLLIFLSFCFR